MTYRTNRPPDVELDGIIRTTSRTMREALAVIAKAPQPRDDIHPATLGALRHRGLTHDVTDGQVACSDLGVWVLKHLAGDRS